MDSEIRSLGAAQQAAILDPEGLRLPQQQPSHGTILRGHTDAVRHNGEAPATRGSGMAPVESLVADSHAAGQPRGPQYHMGFNQNPTGAVEDPTPAARGMPRAASHHHQDTTQENQEGGAAHMRTDGAVAMGGPAGTNSQEVGGGPGHGTINHSNPVGEASVVEGSQTEGPAPPLSPAGGQSISETQPTAGAPQATIIRHLNHRPHGLPTGYFVTGHILGHAVQCLIDSGSMVTLLSKKVYDRLPSDSSLELQDSACTVTGVSGAPVHTYGRLQLPIVVGRQVCLQDTLVADIGDEAILGGDFMRQHEVVLDVPRHTLTVRRERAPLWSSEDQATRLRVVMARRVTVFPNSRVLVSAQLVHTSPVSTAGLVEPLPRLLGKYGVMVSRALVDTRRSEVPLEVLNPTDREVILYPKMTLGFCSSTEGDPVPWTEDPSQCRRVTKGTGVSKLPPHVQELYEDGALLLEEEEKTKFHRELSSRGPILAADKQDFGRTAQVQHGIELQGQPRKQRPKRQPLALQPVEEQEIRTMLEQDIIEPSQSPIASPVVLVKKSDGSYRFCVDYRDLNSHTRKDAYPLPRIEDCLDSLAGAEWFCTLDLCSGYWQVELKEEDRYKTAFCTRSGLYQFKVMSFGLCNAPATFERLMETVLRGLQWKECLVYLDDIIIFGRTFDETLGRLSRVFDRIQDAGLKLNPKKCALFKKEVKFLGHIVTPEGVRTDPAKIEAVEKWPTPRSTKDVRSFLGLASYYRKFVKGFSSIARPLHHLTGKGVPFEWNPAAHQAFEELKKALSSTPILAYPQPEGQIILDTDASGDAVGAVLSQVQGGEERVLGYLSKALSDTQRNYCVTRKELLAVVVALARFHPYVWGRPVILRTDNTAVLWMKRLKEPAGQMARWLVEVDRYDLTIEHRPGRVHWNADALSRRPCHQCGSEEGLCEEPPVTTEGRLLLIHAQPGRDERPLQGLTSVLDDLTEEPLANMLPTIPEEEEDVTPVQMTSPEPLGTPATEATGKLDCRVLTRAQRRQQEKELGNQAWMEGWTIEELQEEQDNDPEIGPIVKALSASQQKPVWQAIAAYGEGVKTLWCQWDRLRLDRGILYRRWESVGGQASWQMVVPLTKREMVISHHHGSNLGGHFDCDKTTQKIKARFFWPGLRDAVLRFCRACDQCVARKTVRKPRAPLKRYQVGMPHERVAIDLMGPLNESERGNRQVLVVSDHFTKWTEAYALPDSTAETVARALVEEWVCRYGPPRFLHSDQGRQFESEVFQEMCRLLGLTKTRTTALHPEGNGQVERFNRTLGALLAIYVDEHRRNWDDHLPYILAAYRATRHSATKLTPNMLLFGRENALPLHIVMGDPHWQEEVPDPTTYVDELRDRLNLAYALARENLGKSAAIQKHYYDHRAKAVQLQEGQPVWLHNPVRKKGVSPKLTAPWVKGYVIINKLDDVTFRVKSGPQARPVVVHANRLMPYRGPNPPEWYQPLQQAGEN